MSEITENPGTENPGTETPGTETPGTDTPGTGPETPGTETPVTSTSALNNAVESVMDMIDALGLFAKITRGALGIGNSLSCEISPTVPEEVYLSKDLYIPLTLAINGKHDDLRVLSDSLNTIMDTLSMKKEYTSGNGWQIVDITNGNMPRIIGREDNNSWLMACDIIVKIYRKDD